MRGVLLFFFLFGCGGGGDVEDAGFEDRVVADAPIGDAPSDAITTDAGADAISDAQGSDVADVSVLPDAGPGTYAAYKLIGGFDRVRVAKTTMTTCFMIGLVSPSGQSTGGLTLPQSWYLEYARAVQPAAACNPAYMGPISNTYDATSRSGSIAWMGSGIPATITTVAATLTFNNHPNWCPASETLATSNLAVQ